VSFAAIRPHRRSAGQANRMTSAHPIRPTDLVALAAGRLHVNEAVTWDRLGQPPHVGRLLWPAVEGWATLNARRQIWVSGQATAVFGAVSVRPRGGRLAWQIDRLSIAPEADESAVGMALLDAAASSAVDAGVMRIFLRLRSDRVEELGVRKAGFTPYLTEHLYALAGPFAEEATGPTPPLRRRERADGFPLFRLYNAVTPLSVRQHEASTYAEWIAAQERRGRGRGRLDEVVADDGEATAWLRAVPDGSIGRIDLLAQAGSSVQHDALLAHAVRSLGKRRPICALVPAYAEGLAALLERHGFAAVEEYTSFVRRLVMPIALAEPVRAKARNPLVIA
jgi:hypothetical protein